MNEQVAWTCPVCATPLMEVTRTLRCVRGHSFDLAKEGYCNLLLASRTRSKHPGDDKAMLHARRAFLNAGHYEPLVAGIIALLEPYVLPDTLLLDCGCGDGYYAAAVHDALHCTIRGVDIAREAVRLAARRFKQRERSAFAVASCFDMPVPSGAFNVALQVFAPVSETELQRVLAPGGVYCAVFPGPQHLIALKEAMYRTARPHKEPGHPEGFTLLQERRLTFDMPLACNADIRNLLAMTPLNWRGSREGKTALRSMDALTVGADFVVRMYAPPPRASTLD